MIIDEHLIKMEIEQGKSLSIDEILEKAERGYGLTALETSALFQNLSNIDQALRIATELKSKKKGNVAALYTCLYITNFCVNDCSYCGYRSSYDRLTRITLTSEQIKDEARAISDLGVTNAILIGGTVPEEQYRGLIIEGTRSLLEVGLVSWTEFENLSPATLRELNKEGANRFVLFQETYDSEKYEKWHRKSSLKRDYIARLKKVEEAIDSGFTEVNIGALLGLSRDYTFEILGLYYHAKSLQKREVNVCISVPTLQPAPGLSISHERISEDVVEKAYVVLRLALPEVSLALSGRESEGLRNRLFPIVDQIGSGGVPNPGGRTVYRDEYQRGDTQFRLSDRRSPQEITHYLASLGIKVKPKVEWGS